MKNSQTILLSVVLLMTVMVSSCSVVEGIFKAGMGVGIFIVVAIIIVIIVIALRLGKRKN